MACRCPAGSVRRSTGKRGRGFVCISVEPRRKTKRIGGEALTYQWHPFVAAIGCGRRKTRRSKKRRSR
jgi:hypothetical protein